MTSTSRAIGFRIYASAPPIIRDWLASIRGYQLRWWRYGRATELLVEEALSRESWSLDRWKAWQDDRLAFVLHRAATMVPYYREHWSRRRRHGDRSSWEYLENWPILTKDAVRRDPRAFVAEDCDPARMFMVQTSGTSGTPLRLWRTREVNFAWFALFEARWRRWYGVSRRDRWAMLGGQLVVPASQQDPPFWVRNRGLNQLYLSTYHLSPPNAAAYVKALKESGSRYLLGYPSSMYSLALLAAEQGLDTPKLSVAISNAEPLEPQQRELIGHAFQCPVRNTYGMGEAVAAASECDHGKLHLWPEIGIMEVLRDADVEQVPLGTAGRFVATGLLNADMPLIRYEIGDRGALGPVSTRCSCGRNLPILQRIEGRSTDNLMTADGRRIFWINPVFYDLPLHEAQVIQESVDRVRIRVVPTAGYSSQVSALLTRRMRERMGRVDVQIDEVERIPRSTNGKFRAVVRDF